MGFPEDKECSDCTTNAIAYNKCDACKGKPCHHISCPEGICNGVKYKIEKAHMHKKPSWKNTDARKWCKGDPWQIAKCYMPDHGYDTKETIEETDLNGILSVILNHKSIATNLSADLRDMDNKFKKARIFSNRIRHQANLEIDDDKFEEILNVMSDVLNVEELTINKDANEARHNISKLRMCSKENDVSGESVNDELVQKVKEKVKLPEQKSVADIHLVQKEIECIFQKHKEIEKRQKMCQKLREHYEKECSTLPVSALFNDEDAPLLSFYVNPIMQQVSYHRVCTYYPSINSYADIFHKDGKRVQNIYLTGDAGIGKTAVCQRMILCWCHAIHGGTKDVNFTEEDINAMKYFDFLFFVSLRETSFCDITKIIQEQWKTFASSDFIDKLLDEENCLIILDGLDEWTHQPSCCMHRQVKIPDRKVGQKLTYLTTTRPWKIEADRLKTNEIDQQVILKGLDKKKSENLTRFVIDHLNKRFNEAKTYEDFRNTFEKQKQIVNASKIPIIKIQLINLWFADVQSANYSRCAIYNNTIKLLFERVITQKVEDTESQMFAEVKDVKEEKEYDVPDFLDQDDRLSEYQTFLFKIGYLAFDMLFSASTEKNEEQEESILVFDSDIGTKYGLRKEEMDFALYVGILSTNKAIGLQNLLKKVKKLTFLHKSYQEYFAALFIAMKKDPEQKINDVFSKFGSVAEFLKYENFLVFLSGMKITVIGMISNGVRQIVSSDKNVQAYRKSAHYKFGLVVMLKPYHNLQCDIFMKEENGRGALKALQMLLLQCLEESLCNDDNSLDIPLSDVFVDEENNSKLSTIIKSSSQDIKSISTELYCDEYKSLKNLEKLVIMENTYKRSHDDMGKYETCISSCRSSLVSLSLANCKGVRVFNDLEKLTTLALFNISVTHQELSDMFGFITKTITLIQLFICDIKCSDHGKYCTGCTLDLAKHKDLKYLRLQDLLDHGRHMTRLNKTSLELLVFQSGSDGSVIKKIIEDIKNAPKLKEVVFINFKTKDLVENILETVQTLICLERLSFFGADFGDSLLVLSPRQKILNMVTCFDISLTFESICTFVNSLPTSGVVVHLLNSRINVFKGENEEEKDMESAATFVQEHTSFRITNVDKFTLSFHAE